MGGRREGREVRGNRREEIDEGKGAGSRQRRGRDPEWGEGPVLRRNPPGRGRGPAHSPRGGLPAEAQQEEAEAADPGGGHGGPGPAG